ncbi:MAG TPA: thioredoxin fold domain-containing protein [Syntrophorhabdaceae bacterium]|jgi:thioredoxin-related protein
MKTKSPFFTRLFDLWAVGIVAFLLIFAGHSPAFGDDYKDALKRAKSDDKAIVLYFFSQHCGYCEAMDRDVLADRDISAIMKNDLVFVRVDADKRTDIARQYGIRGYPTTALLEPSGKSIIRIPGYLGKKEYKLILDYAKKKLYKSTTLRDYLKKNGVDVG